MCFAINTCLRIHFVFKPSLNYQLQGHHLTQPETLSHPSSQVLNLCFKYIIDTDFVLRAIFFSLIRKLQPQHFQSKALPEGVLAVTFTNEKLKSSSHWNPNHFVDYFREMTFLREHHMPCRIQGTSGVLRERSCFLFWNTATNEPNNWIKIHFIKKCKILLSVTHFNLISVYTAYHKI